MTITEEDSGMGTFVLDARLGHQAAAPLLASLRARRIHPVSIDAGKVSHLGGRCLQVLLAAATEWRRRGQRLTLSPLSAGFSEALQIYGIGRDDLQAPGTSAPAAKEARWPSRSLPSTTVARSGTCWHLS